LQQNAIIPHPYLITNLTTQYRSIPSVGHNFSAFAYDNRLAHSREKATQRPLKLDNLPLKPINIIRFPVNKLETLYRSQRLNGSHYHIYSALLTAELAKYLVEQIFKNHIQTKKKAKPWRIGIICPYKAQAQMVDKILAAQHIFKPKVSVTCGTIHSFQGDECDIMINLYNPPSYISKSPNMFLNRTNIINVGISRAKDYLILLIPDKETDKVWNLEEIGRMLNIIRHDLKGEYWEKNASEIEQILFDMPNYLEQNTFATTHQSINVYTEPEKQFEIRVEEMAVDVQVGKKY
jgi:superfamily I DNA and/or RNA helicase